MKHYTIDRSVDGGFAHADPCLLSAYERTGRVLETLAYEDTVFTEEDLAKSGLLDPAYVGERGKAIIQQVLGGGDPDALMQDWRNELADMA